MTEIEFDKLLRSALMEAVWQDFAPAIEAAKREEITFSERYLKRREKMLQDPFAYAKKAALTFTQRVARTAAMILLVCSILFAVAMTVPEVRAAIKKLYMEWYETHIAVYVQDDTGAGETDLSKIHVEIPENVLPEGYREYSREDHAGVIVYSGNAGRFITIDYHSAGTGHEVETNNNGIVVQKMVVDEVEYYQFEATAENRMSQIMWLNDKYSLVFRITASEELDMEDLFLLAKNILVVTEN